MSDFDVCRYWLAVANRKKSKAFRAKVFGAMNKARTGQKVF